MGTPVTSVTSVISQTPETPDGIVVAEGPSSVQNAPGPPPSSVQDAPAEKAESFDWLAEVWIDPDWYQTQEADDPCPSPGLPIDHAAPPRSVLIGRVIQSRNTHPEIDLSSDPGRQPSACPAHDRRHPVVRRGPRQLQRHLRRARRRARCPDGPIAVGPKTELGDDDRLYVGAWTRVVVRRATPDEVEAYA